MNNTLYSRLNCQSIYILFWSFTKIFEFINLFGIFSEGDWLLIPFYKYFLVAFGLNKVIGNSRLNCQSIYILFWSFTKIFQFINLFGFFSEGDWLLIAFYIIANYVRKFSSMTYWGIHLLVCFLFS